MLLTYWIQRQWVAFPKLIVVQNFPNSHFLKHNIIWNMLPLSTTTIFALASSLILVKSTGMSKYPLCISLLSIFMWLTTSVRFRVIYKLNQDVFVWLVQKKQCGITHIIIDSLALSRSNIRGIAKEITLLPVIVFWQTQFLK